MQDQHYNSWKAAREGETATSNQETTTQLRTARPGVCLFLAEEDLDLLPKASWRILGRLSNNQTPAEIRESLWITQSTWQSHMRTINSAFGTRCYREAVAKARELGLVV